MPAQKTISREYRIYLALWRKALTSDKMLNITCPSLSLAVAMRQGMYRAIQPFRQSLDDVELMRAAEKYVVYLRRPESRAKDEPHFLEFRERKTLAFLEEELGLLNLGLDEEDLLIGNEREVELKLKDLINSENTAPRSTPFYKRDS